MDDLEEQLPRARIEDKDSAIDWLGGQVTFKCLQAEGEGKDKKDAKYRTLELGYALIFSMIMSCDYVCAPPTL